MEPASVDSDEVTDLEGELWKMEAIKLRAQCQSHATKLLEVQRENIESQAKVMVLRQRVETLETLIAEMQVPTVQQSNVLLDSVGPSLATSSSKDATVTKPSK